MRSPAEMRKHPWLVNSKIVGLKLPDELPFENLYLKQKVTDMEQGPRCLAEEYTSFEYTLSTLRNCTESSQTSLMANLKTSYFNELFYYKSLLII